MADNRKIVIGVQIDTTAAEGSLQELEDTVESLRKELNKQEIGSDRFQELAREIQKVESEIKDVELAFESLDSEQRLTAASDAVVGLAGGFAAAEGAAALFGAESQELEETLRRVSGALALSQGLRDLANGAIALKKLGGAANVARKAQVALNNAVKSNPIGALAAAIIAATAAIVVFVEKSHASARALSVEYQAQKALTEARVEASKEIQATVVELNSLVAVARDENATQEARREAIKQLNELSPQYLGDLNEQNVLTEEGAKLINNFTAALEKRAMAQALEEKLVDLQKQRIDALTQSNRENVGVVSDFFSTQLNIFKSGGDIAKLQAEQQKTAAENRNEATAAIDTQIKAISGLLAETKQEELQLDANTRAYEHQVVSRSNNTEQINKERLALLALNKERSQETAKLLSEIETLENEFLDSQLDREQQQINAVEDRYFRVIELAEKAGIDTTTLEEARLAQIAEIRSKFREEENQALLDGAAIAEAADKRKKESDDKLKQKQIDNEMALFDARLEMANATVGILNSLQGVVEEGSAASKALAIAEIAANTGIGFIQGLVIAQKSAAAAGPGAALLFPTFYATQIAAVLAAAGKAKQIVGAGGSESAPSIPSVGGTGNTAINPISNTASLVNQSQQEIVSRVVVVESDITAAQDSVASVAESASF